MSRVFLSLLLVAVGVTALSSTAGAANGLLACGEVVTENVTLDRSLTDCASGITVGASGVTIDLNGHSIAGSGAGEGVGIEAAGQTSVTIKNGTVRNFQTGVRLLGASSSTLENLVVRGTQDGIVVSGEGNEILENKVVDSGTGITVFPSGSIRVVGNKLHDLAGVGLICRFGFGQTDVLIARNRSARNDVGVVLEFCAASLVDNDASENRRFGIFRTRSSGLLLKNTANRNGAAGIVSDDSHGLIHDNVTNANGGSGLVIADVLPEHGPLHTLMGHTAKRNAGLGIDAFAGVIDGGGNVAKHNGDPRECVTIACG